ITDHFPVTSIDGTEHVVTVTIHGTDDAPVAIVDHIETNEDTSIIIDLINNDIDVDNNELTVTRLNGVDIKAHQEQTINVEHGQIKIDTHGAMTFVPVHNFSGDVHLTYTVSDGQLSSNSTATIIVKPIVDPVNVKVTVDVAEIHVLSEVTKHYTSWNDVVREYGKDAHTLTSASETPNILPTENGVAYRGMAGHDDLSVWQATNQGKGSVLIGGDGDLAKNHTNTGDEQDSLYGGNGNDIFVGEQGDDGLYGKGGIDTAVYSGKFSDYNITANIIDTSNHGGNHKFTVTDKLYNPQSSNLNNEGQDTLYDIERLQFSDGIYDWNEGAHAWQPEIVIYSINIDAALTDTDGSEEITKIDISGIPKGSVLYDDAHTKLGIANADGHIVLMPSDWGLQSRDHIHVELNNLHLEVPADTASNIALTVTATGHEIHTKQIATGSDNATLNYNIHSGVESNISEEGLVHSNPDNIGNPEDTTNKTVAEGSFKVTGVDSTDVSVRLEGPDDITSDGKSVRFVWDKNSQELDGFIGNSDHKAITITLSHDHAGDYSYHVNLMAPIDHSINNVEDIQAIKVAVITNDSEQKNVECQQTITINIEDDSPIIESSHQDVFNVVADTNIPNIISSDYFSLVSNHSDTAELRPKSGHHHHDGHFTVTAQAFENNHNANLIDGLVSSSHDGIGVANNIDPNDVKSTYQPNGSYSKYDYDNFPLNNEVEYRHIKDNDGHLISSASEQIIITLDDNYVAYGLHIDFSQMFGGEKEVGAVDYYRNGKCLDTQSFSSDEVSGDFAKDFNYHQGGFDEIRIRATDNGGKYADNSDFSIKGIQFTGNSDHDFAKGYVSGDINVKYGADGSQHIGNSALSDGLDAVIDVKNLTTITGKSIAISHDENSNTYYGVGRDDPSHHLFKFELTQSTGKWEFYQYSQINDHDNQGIKVNFTATDNDGDHAYQTIFIKPTDATTNEVHTTLLHSAENEHSLLNLDLHSESISLHHQDGEKELTHFDVNKGHLDLSDLLHNATENTIDHYLTIHQDGNDTVLSVNVDARNDVEQNIVLDNTKLGDVKANLGVITNNLLHFDGDKLILEHHSEHANSAYEPMVLPHQLIDEHNN
ncbi:Ig-like domain-containing protein, partial [Photobacterium carnosum]|uniref:Ig-like domain-containing protein n=1 Tax=Photobacterium carnosum TaxID=2023717 RepID=UPI001E30E1EC